MTKVCHKCKLDKKWDDFYIETKTNKPVSRCKSCQAQYYKENKTKILKRCSEYRQENITQIRIRNKKYKDSRRDEINRKGREYYKNNKAQVKKNGRKANLRKYGLTIDLYDQLLSKQNSKCAICFISILENGENLNIDHDHACCPGNYSCGKCIRGLLCYSCNLGIGNLKDNVILLQNAINYLQSWNKTT